MGETTDQLRAQVDASRESATQKIEDIQEQVMGTVSQAEQKVTEATQQVKEQVKEKLDWRAQVEQRPLLAVGAALVGGIVLGGMTGKGNNGGHSYSQHSGAQFSGQSQSGGISSSIRNAARDSGLDDAVQSLASGVFTMFGDRMKTMAEEYMPGISDKMNSIRDSGNRQSTGASEGQYGNSRETADWQRTTAADTPMSGREAFGE